MSQEAPAATEGAEALPARGATATGVAPLTWLVVLSCLNVMDLLTTRMVLDRGGEEGNPLMAPFVEHGWSAWAIKAAVLVALVMLVARCPRSRPLAFALVAVNVWYAIVVCWNVQVLVELS